jgi:hypothetical protein
MRINFVERKERYANFVFKENDYYFLKYAVKRSFIRKVLNQVFQGSVKTLIRSKRSRVRYNNFRMSANQFK